MVANLLFQLLAMVTMEPPTSLDAAAIRSEKAQPCDGVPGDATPFRRADSIEESGRIVGRVLAPRAAARSPSPTPPAATARMARRGFRPTAGARCAEGSTA